MYHTTTFHILNAYGALPPCNKQVRKHTGLKKSVVFDLFSCFLSSNSDRRIGYYICFIFLYDVCYKYFTVRLIPKITPKRGMCWQILVNPPNTTFTFCSIVVSSIYAYFKIQNFIFKNNWSILSHVTYPNNTLFSIRMEASPKFVFSNF